MGKLDGKVTVITGATTGIGAETARLFIKEGARVVLGGRREHLAQQLANELGAAAVPFRMDVTQEPEISSALEFAIERFGRLDCLMNNAGSAGVLGPIDATPTDAFWTTHSRFFSVR
jgi:NADP-dependent 3-hydroxy acid dehydrogenase YdfG